MKRRDWTSANVKRGPCRVCSTEVGVELHHTAGRATDKTRTWNGSPSKTLVVDPDAVVPLCGPSTDTSSCHNKAETGRIDLMVYLTLAEQVYAVEALGGIENARIKLCPSAYPRRAAA